MSSFLSSQLAQLPSARGGAGGISPGVNAGRGGAIVGRGESAVQAGPQPLAQPPTPQPLGPVAVRNTPLAAPPGTVTPTNAGIGALSAFFQSQAQQQPTGGFFQRAFQAQNPQRAPISPPGAQTAIGNPVVNSGERMALQQFLEQQSAQRAPRQQAVIGPGQAPAGTRAPVGQGSADLTGLAGNLV